MNGQREGLQFEELFKKISFMQGFYPERIPNGCRIVRTPYGLKPIMVKSPFDFILYHQKGTISLDLKTIMSKKINFTSGKAELIKNHQIRSLYNIEKMGQLAGFLVWFRKINIVEFFKASLALETDRKSFETGQGVKIGPIEKMDLNAFWTVLEPIKTSLVVDLVP